MRRKGAGKIDEFVLVLVRCSGILVVKSKGAAPNNAAVFRLPISFLCHEFVCSDLWRFRAQVSETDGETCEQNKTEK